jgi:predicted metal-dependent enzyme (double-stranded beta helix superfamily)
MTAPSQISYRSRSAGGHLPLGCSPAAATISPALSGSSSPSALDVDPNLDPAPAPASAEPLPAHVLADIAGGFAAATPLWSRVVRHDPDGRQPVRLIATERYEVWVIGWTPGQNVRVHDHGDSSGAFVVTDGELTEVLPGGAGGAVERVLGTGRLRHLTLGTVHDVVNRSASPATSIHVYSPPLTSMTYYDADTFEAVETEAVAPERPVLEPGGASYVLHPVQGTRT